MPMGENWVILQITPADTYANFIGVGDHKKQQEVKAE